MPEVTVEGFTYPTLKDACRAYGTNYNTAYTRVQKGMDYESAVLLPNRNNITSKDHLGNEYPSITEMCLAYGIHPATFNRRVNQGWSIERILTTPSDTTKWTRKTRRLHEKTYFN